MAREKHETPQQYDRRCRQAERERRILSYAPLFWLTLIALFFGYFMFIYDPWIDPRMIVPESIRAIPLSR